MRVIARIVATMIGAVVGLVVGYMAAVYLTCESPVQVVDGGNLCGLLGVFVTGPLGLIAGAVAGWFLSRPKAATPPGQ